MGSYFCFIQNTKLKERRIFMTFSNIVPNNLKVKQYEFRKYIFNCALQIRLSFNHVIKEPCHQLNSDEILICCKLIKLYNAFSALILLWVLHNIAPDILFESVFLTAWIRIQILLKFLTATIQPSLFVPSMSPIADKILVDPEVTANLYC